MKNFRRPKLRRKSYLNFFFRKQPGLSIVTNWQSLFCFNVEINSEDIS